MSNTAEEYRSVVLANRLRSQAYWIWILALLIVVVWTLLILTAPIAKFSGAGTVSSPLYTFFGYICHQMPERSLHVLGEQLGVCSRCFGVYLGLVVGVAVYPMWRGIDSIEPPSRFWLFLSILPIGIDWSLTAFGIWENTQASRFGTGLILGVACATFIIPALVEIVRIYRFPKLKDNRSIS